MAKLRLICELDYDAEAMHGDEEESRLWFTGDVLGGDGLVLHENDQVGDDIGTLKVLRVDGPWECKTTKNRTPDPQDCDWPVCGCDPTANRVIAALEESGKLPDHLAALLLLSAEDALVEQVRESAHPMYVVYDTLYLPGIVSAMLRALRKKAGVNG